MNYKMIAKITKELNEENAKMAMGSSAALAALSVEMSQTIERWQAEDEQRKSNKPGKEMV